MAANRTRTIRTIFTYGASFGTKTCRAQRNGYSHGTPAVLKRSEYSRREGAYV
jgi:hypothetical protein